MKELSNLDHLIERYFAGESMKKLADEEGLDSGTLKRRFSEKGVQFRSRAESTTIANRRKIPDHLVAEILSDYARGSTVSDLCAKFAYSPGKAVCKRYPGGSGILGILSREGVTIRPVNEVRKSWWTRNQDPFFRAAHMIAAQTAGAAMREKTLRVRMSPIENQLFGALDALGADCVQQKCVGRYNLDISFKEFPIAVEIEVGSAFAKGRCSFAFDRIEYLLNQGWNVIYVIVRRKKPAVRLIAEKLIAFSDLVRSNESIRGQYGVICSEGNPISGCRYYLKSWPRIPTF